MSVPVGVHGVQLGNRFYPIAYTSNAIVRLEKGLGEPIQRIGQMLSSGRAGFGFMQTVLWAGLEGARLRGLHGKDEPVWTVDRVGDKIDETPGMSLAFWTQHSEAIGEAFKEAFPNVDEQSDSEGKPTADPPGSFLGGDS